jgi:hypothetical protein
MAGQYFVNFSCIKFHENPFSSARIIPWIWTERQNRESLIDDQQAGKRN